MSSRQDRDFDYMSGSSCYHAFPIIISYLRFYHLSPNDDNFYLVTCKIISQENSSDDHDHYNHEFFYQHPSDPSARYIVTCKLLPHYLVEDILNGEAYGMNYNIG